MKKYINPVCKVMTMNLKQSLLDEKFGNKSFVPVGGSELIDGENGNEGPVEQMFTNTSVWE